MAEILEVTAVFSHSVSMVNCTMTVLWMGTGENGAPPPMTSAETESGDCVTTKAMAFSRPFSLPCLLL